MALALALNLAFGSETVLVFLRIKGDLAQISSQRWGGALELLAHFSKSPIVGEGFGAVDDGFHIWPVNIFYISILVEIGLIGSIGLFIFLYYPAIKITFMRIFSDQVDLDEKINTTVGWSLSVVSAFLVYFWFEFDVFRVSANNQLFFFSFFNLLLICFNRNRLTRR